MKKLLLLLAVGAMSVSLAAAQAGEDKGPMYPAAGTIGVGIEADPILDYIGNMFNNSTSNNASARWDTHLPALYLRYFLFDKAAVRARFEFNAGRNSTVNHVADEAARRLNPLSRKEVEDLMTVAYHEYDIRLGYQMFRGNHRLKGFYGGDIYYSYSNTDREYMYGNKMSQLNPSPLSTNDFSTLTTGNEAKRTLAKKGVTSHGFGLNAFTGAEFYFMPQACIGFEVGLVFGGNVTGKGRVTTEEMVGSVYNKLERTTPEGLTSELVFHTQVAKPHGSFYFVFHF